MQSSNTLLSWLTRGECSRKNANVFYSLIQTTNAHVRRLLTEKENHEQEIENMKANFRQQIQGILRQCKCATECVWVNAAGLRKGTQGHGYGWRNTKQIPFHCGISDNPSLCTSETELGKIPLMSLTSNFQRG